MNQFTPLDPGNLQPFCIEEREHLGGPRYLFRFPNSLGAVVVKNEESYGHEDGLFTLCGVGFDGKAEVKITGVNSIGHLTNAEVVEKLREIKEM